MSVYPPAEPYRQYILENATERQKLMSMLSVTLYNDGTARLSIPPISSYFFGNECFYTFTDDELVIYQDNENIIARFTVVDDHTLTFKESSVLLYAETDARYVSTP